MGAPVLVVYAPLAPCPFPSSLAPPAFTCFRCCFHPLSPHLLGGLIVMQRPVDVDVTVLYFRSWRTPMQLSCAFGCVCRCVCECLCVLRWVCRCVSVCVCLGASVGGVLYCATRLAHAKVVGVLGAVFSSFLQRWRQICINFLLPTFIWAATSTTAHLLAPSQAFDCYPHNPGVVVKVKDKVVLVCVCLCVCMKLV